MASKLKNITLSADEELIKAARRIAREENTTLNSLFREWLEQYRSRDQIADNYLELMKQLSYSTPGKKFTRDERNER